MSGFNTCEKDGCNANVMRSSGHKLCARHRPKIPYKHPTIRNYKKGEKERVSRTRASVGIPTWW
jgi:hypothetical protein